MTNTNNQNIFKDRNGNEKIRPAGREVTDRKSAYGLALENNKILFVKPAWKQDLDLPGGGVEKGETLTESLIREFYEETGARVTPVSTEPLAIIGQLFYADDIDKYFDSKQYFFLVKIKEIDKQWKPDEKEIRELIWCAVADLDKSNIKKTHLQVVKDFLAKQKS